jgi:tRNA threonylcarbamoyladenosine biosynthesis protein TsaB
MIDARRMEVFAAVYDKLLHPLISPQVMSIQENSFTGLFSSHKILFCGNGSKKLQRLISNSNAMFTHTLGNASDLVTLSYDLFCKKNIC